MKNLKVGKKIFVGFAVVVAMMLVMGAVVITTNTMISGSVEDIRSSSDLQTLVNTTLSTFSGARVHANTLYYVDDETVAAQFVATDAEVERMVDEAIDFAKKDDTLDIYIKPLQDFKAGYLVWSAEVDDIIANDDRSRSVINATESKGIDCVDQITKISKDLDVDMEGDITTTQSVASSVMLAIILVTFVSIVIAVIMGAIISRLIRIPTQGLSFSLKYFAETGNLQLPDDIMALAQSIAQRKDELGETAVNYGLLMERLGYLTAELDKIASGDLTSTIKIASEKDAMGKSLSKMIDNLNQKFGEISQSTDQVSSGARQIADGAQSLAQGSTEQAAAVEQLSTSIGEIAVKTQENADMATRAAQLSTRIRESAQKGSEQMDQMTQAVSEINEASQSISKVIKVIDDIAFQTNILALNAAVEAARAGQHGKGFAVVAEEVRSLAAKSADAAKDTGGLIENSMLKAELGAKIASETAASLSEIVSGINESTIIMNDIAHFSDEQSTSIKQVNRGIDQVAQVVQQNSATAEQSAAASEEMSGQSDLLGQLVSQFKLKDQEGWSNDSSRGRSTRMLGAPTTHMSHSFENEGFSKY